MFVVKGIFHSLHTHRTDIIFIKNTDKFVSKFRSRQLRIRAGTGKKLWTQNNIATKIGKISNVFLLSLRLLVPRTRPKRSPIKVLTHSIQGSTRVYSEIVFVITDVYTDVE